ncbi:hypothetical protein EF909_05610 [Streptomyces sp. WAC01280]|nr:hypothetical protein EF909_05610 [Streptomyces sp. WAC01280]
MGRGFPVGPDVVRHGYLPSVEGECHRATCSLTPCCPSPPSHTIRICETECDQGRRRHGGARSESVCPRGPGEGRPDRDLGSLLRRRRMVVPPVAPTATDDDRRDLL